MSLRADLERIVKRLNDNAAEFDDIMRDFKQQIDHHFYPAAKLSTPPHESALLASVERAINETDRERSQMIGRTP